MCVRGACVQWGAPGGPARQLAMARAQAWSLETSPMVGGQLLRDPPSVAAVRVAVSKMRSLLKIIFRNGDERDRQELRVTCLRIARAVQVSAADRRARGQTRSRSRTRSPRRDGAACTDAERGAADADEPATSASERSAEGTEGAAAADDDEIDFGRGLRCHPAYAESSSSMSISDEESSEEPIAAAAGDSTIDRSINEDSSELTPSSTDAAAEAGARVPGMAQRPRPKARPLKARGAEVARQSRSAALLKYNGFAREHAPALVKAGMPWRDALKEVSRMWREHQSMELGHPYGCPKCMWKGRRACGRWSPHHPHMHT